MKKNKEMKTAVVYVRSSNDGGTCTSIQFKELCDFCKIHEIKIIKTLKDVNSPIHDERFEEIINELKEVKPNYLVVYGWERITRCWEQAAHLEQVLRPFGIEVVAAHGPISDIEFKEKFDFFYSMLKSVESETRSKKIRAGLRKRKELDAKHSNAVV